MNFKRSFKIIPIHAPCAAANNYKFSEATNFTFIAISLKSKDKRF